MFGIGLPELLIIIIAILVFFGPAKIPELARQFARFFVQIRKVSSDSREVIDKIIWEAEEELQKEKKEVKNNNPSSANHH